jgi:DNA-binding response OmpR family regulator
MTTGSSSSRLLIVDDEPTVRMALELAAGEQGWQIESVPTGEAALTLLASKPFDLLMVDKNLPGVSGVEIIRRVRERDKDIAIIMMTGFASPESAAETLHLGVDAYLEKPFDDIYAVLNKMTRILEMRHRRRMPVASALASFQRAKEALQKSSRPAGTTEARVGVLSPVASDRDWFVTHFGSAGDLFACASLTEMLDRVRKGPPPVLIIDSAVTTLPLPKAVEKLREAAPHAAVIIVCATRLSLSVIAELIELDVRVLVDKPLEVAGFKKKLDEVFARLAKASGGS